MIKIKQHLNYPSEKSKAGKTIELVVLSFLLSILIAPGLFFTDIMAHEFYHYAMHTEISEEICLDINKPYSGHVKIIFNNEEELLKYESEGLNEEEKMANIVGHGAAFLYLINAMVVVNWILMLIVRKQKER
ncbi:MAG: hypothetical protein KKA79_08055 [Nanoarchaeota archaeon]|nr:hypothetical protein [Nanoarchaeota archaeon]